MVDVEREGPVARIFLNRPEKANALNSVMLEKLRDAVRGLEKDETLRVAMLAGRGGAFCGGADTHELRALDAETAPVFVARIHDVCKAIRDLRVAADGTKFAMPEVRLGIPSVVEAALLPRLVGSGRAAWLVLTGEAIDARRALEWGLIEEIETDGAIHRLVQNLLAGDREALRMQKQLLQLWDEASLATSVTASIERFAQAHR